jgi:hypothetical protein
LFYGQSTIVLIREIVLIRVMKGNAVSCCEVFLFSLSIVSYFMFCFRKEYEIVSVVNKQGFKLNLFIDNFVIES